MQDKTEWKLNGQVLVFTLPLSDQACSSSPCPALLHVLPVRAAGSSACSPHCSSTGLGSRTGTKALKEPFDPPQVSVIKVKIHEATGMPAGKQKLQYEVGIRSSNAGCFFSAFSHMTFIKRKIIMYNLIHSEVLEEQRECFFCLHSTAVTDLPFVTAGQVIKSVNFHIVAAADESSKLGVAFSEISLLFYWSLLFWFVFLTFNCSSLAPTALLCAQGGGRACFGTLAAQGRLSPEQGREGLTLSSLSSSGSQSCEKSPVPF